MNQKSCEREDLEVIASSNVDFNQYKDSTIFVTGATGFIGSFLVKSFLLANRKLQLNLAVVAAMRDREKAKKVLGDFVEDPALDIVEYRAINVVKYSSQVDYIFHTACVTNSKIMVEEPVKTIETSYIGTRNILEFANEKHAKGVIYVSSMEVYGQPDQQLEMVKEENLGYIDLSNVRSSYSEGKRICECLCTAYASQYQIPVKIARLAQTFGAGVFEGDNRVYAQFAKSAIQGNNIVLHTDGTSEGNYCYIRDAIIALLMLSYKGVDGQAYNVVNQSMHMEIREMAQLVAKDIAKGMIQVVFDIPESSLIYGYAPKVKMYLSGEKMSSLGWKPQVGMMEAYQRMIHDMCIDKK